MKLRTWSEGEIKRILDEHALWLETDGQQGERANLEGANLVGANLEGANLEGANLEGANLEGAILFGADLQGAFLIGANLRGAILEGAILIGAILKGANLIEAKLKGAILNGAILEGANLKGAILFGADLQGAILQRAILFGADLQGAILQRAILFGADLQGAILQGAILVGANLRGANLRGANLRGANLEGAILEGAILENVFGLPPRFRPKGPARSETVLRSEQQARAAERRIDELEDKLRKAETDATKREELNTELQVERERLASAIQKTEDLQAQLDKKLSASVENAIRVLKASLTQTKEDIRSYRDTSFWLTGLGIVSIVAGFVITPLMWKYFPLPDTPHWFDYFARFTPAAACFLAATTALRHDAKLRQRYEHLSIQQHRVELAGGLLEAATELSKVDGWQTLAPIPETFSHILGQALGPDGARADDHDNESDFADTFAKQALAAMRKGLSSPT